VVRPAVGYALRSKGDEGLTQALGTSVALLGRTPRSEIGARLRADVFLPHEQGAGPGVKIDLGGFGFGLGFAVARRAWRSVWVSGEVGPGLDFVRYHAGPLQAPTLSPSSGGVSIRPNGTFRLGVGVDAGALTIGLEALLVVEWLHTHYDVAVGGARSVVLVPGDVQPAAGAWVGW
jgi:hypothetical protein